MFHVVHANTEFVADLSRNHYRKIVLWTKILLNLPTVKVAIPVLLVHLKFPNVS